jgi:hypothetical protein
MWMSKPSSPSAQNVGIKFRDRYRLEHELAGMTVIGAQPQHVVDEIEIDLELARPVWNGRRRQAARSHVKRDMPGVIEPRRLGQPNLADNLRRQMQRAARLLPGRMAVPAR